MRWVTFEDALTVMETMLIWLSVENYVGAIDLYKFGLIGLLLIATVLLAVSTVPGAVGVVIGDTGLSPQSMVTVMVTVRDCAGNPVRSVAIQLQSFGYGQWAYTDSNGNAFLSVPPGTYTLQGDYSTFAFSQRINVGTGGYSVTLNLGSSCSSSSSTTTRTTT